MANPIAVPGTVVSAGALVTPGGAQGVQGLQGLPGPTTVSTDANNVATLGSDSKIYVPDPTPTIWSTRLRSFNAIGNPNFEVSQRNCGATLTSPVAGTFIEDRWFKGGTGTYAINVGLGAYGTYGAPVAGGFTISNRSMQLTLTGQQTSLGATDHLRLSQNIEGSCARELMTGPTSISLYAYCSVALNFGIALRDSNTTHSLTKLCSIPAGVYTLVQLPNLPAFSTVSGGNFGYTPGVLGYTLDVVLAAGSTFMSPANDVWQSGNYIGAVGQDNFCAKPVNTTVFLIVMLQHEPGAVCTTLIDKPFTQNLAECQRYYTKSYAYGTKAGTVAATGCFTAVLGPSTDPNLVYIPFKVTLAKPPTITGYSTNSGVVNAIYDATTPSDRSITAPSNIGDSAFNGFNLSGRPTAQWFCYFHYTADTGW